MKNASSRTSSPPPENLDGLQMKTRSGIYMKRCASAAWQGWLGLSLSFLGILIAVLSIGAETMLIFLASAILTIVIGLIQLSSWSKLRQSWLFLDARPASIV